MILFHELFPVQEKNFAAVMVVAEERATAVVAGPLTLQVVAML